MRSRGFHGHSGSKTRSTKSRRPVTRVEFFGWSRKGSPSFESSGQTSQAGARPLCNNHNETNQTLKSKSRNTPLRKGRVFFFILPSGAGRWFLGFFAVTRRLQTEGDLDQRSDAGLEPGGIRHGPNGSHAPAPSTDMCSDGRALVGISSLLTRSPTLTG
jgi:hypothetical protein